MDIKLREIESYKTEMNITLSNIQNCKINLKECEEELEIEIKKNKWLSDISYCYDTNNLDGFNDNITNKYNDNERNKFIDNLLEEKKKQYQELKNELENLKIIKYNKYKEIDEIKKINTEITKLYVNKGITTHIDKYIYLFPENEYLNL